MCPGIDFQKQFVETVYVNLPGPADPEPGMTGGELLQGFLAGLYNAPTKELQEEILRLCSKWNVVYRNHPK